ncbi:hypothetical protein HaLaN_05566 [Haematococcus lacustris]|uniref:Uncharacterized protein n=1 Tax=Haematococcus lacustris TaxID=44745 RepID=A0A699YJL0_HAELA|nr:hypothetical protein HaLaN_05566 [Haematococcus lacustris]
MSDGGDTRRGVHLVKGQGAQGQAQAKGGGAQSVTWKREALPGSSGAVGGGRGGLAWEWRKPRWSVVAVNGNGWQPWVGEMCELAGVLVAKAPALLACCVTVPGELNRDLKPHLEQVQEVGLGAVEGGGHRGVRVLHARVVGTRGQRSSATADVIVFLHRQTIATSSGAAAFSRQIERLFHVAQLPGRPRNLSLAGMSRCLGRPQPEASLSDWDCVAMVLVWLDCMVWLDLSA